MIPFLLRAQRMVLQSVKPFVFPEGSRPNISEPFLFETTKGLNMTDFNLIVEDMVLYLIEKNHTKSEEEMIIDWQENDPNDPKTSWEQMTQRFG
jgi:hypothetical protein